MQVQLECTDEFDKRIIKEFYRNHTLIARYWDGEYRGVIWKGKTKLLDVDARNLDSLVQKLRNNIDQRVEQRFAARGSAIPTAEEIGCALKEILPTLSERQKLVLTTHLRSPDGSFSASRLTEAADYNSSTDLMLDYAHITQKLSDELGYAPANTSGHQPNSLSLLLTKDGLNFNDRITLKPELLSSMRKAIH